MYVRTSFKYSFFFSFKNEHLKDKTKNITFFYYFLSFIYNKRYLNICKNFKKNFKIN